MPECCSCRVRYCGDFIVYSFFFFQAEDGIRDYKVTGVQTCALPIFTVNPELTDIQFSIGEHAFNFPILAAALDAVVDTRLAIELGRRGGLAVMNLEGRSGERRVGEEGRSRGGPYY